MTFTSFSIKSLNHALAEMCDDIEVSTLNTQDANGQGFLLLDIDIGEGCGGRNWLKLWGKLSTKGVCLGVSIDELKGEKG